MHLNFDQQRVVFNPMLAKAVNVIGVGSVGSQLVELLAKVGCSDITVWDADTVDSHNVPMSLYWPSHILRPKVDALAEIIQLSSALEIRRKCKMYEGEPLKTSVVACVDTMEARMLVWSRVKQNPLVELYVDTRVAQEYIEVFTIRPCDPDDIGYYEHFLYPSKDAAQISCGRHGAKHVGGTAANIACSALTQCWKSGNFNKHIAFLCGDFKQII